MPARQFRTTVDPRTVGVLVTADSGFTTLTLNVVATNTLPQTYPYTLVIDPDTTSEEIVTVTAGSSNILTVVRAQDNTTLKEHSVGAVVRHMVTARDLQEPQEHMLATGRYLDGISGSYYDPHGLGTGHGVFVGTTKTQELTNKTITGAALSGTTTNNGTISGGTINATGVPASGITGTTLPVGITTATGLAITESQVTNLVSDLAAKAPLASPALTGTASIVNATLSGTLTNNGTITGGTVSPTTINVATINSAASGTVNLSSGATLALGNAGNITASGITITSLEVSYLDNLNSNIQSQINAIGTWQTWTPTMNSSNWYGSFSNSKYTQIGKTIHFRTTFTLSASSGSATGMNISLPVTAFAATKTLMGTGLGTVDSVGSPTFVLDQSSATAFNVKYMKAFSSTVNVGVSTNVTGTLPNDWQNTNFVTVYGTYEAA